MGYQQRIVIVTGAASGIGRGMALGFASTGDHILVCDVDEPKAKETVSTIIERGGSARFIPLDLTSQESIEALVETMEGAEGQVDILVNVAGICKQEDFFETSEKVWDATFNINLKGLFFISKTIAQMMAESRGGSIINISSTSAYISSSQCMIAYDVSKAAVRHLTLVMAEWLGPMGIRVNAIAPATTKTPLITEIFGEHYWEGAWLRRKYPLGRIAEVDDLVNAALFLSSNDARYINGQTMIIDGGCLLAYRRQ